MYFIGSGHIPLEQTEMLQESPDLNPSSLDFAPELLGLAPRLARLASHSLFSDWTGAGEKGLVTLGHILCLYQNLGRDYSLIFPRDPKIA